MSRMLIQPKVNTEIFLIVNEARTEIYDFCSSYSVAASRIEEVDAVVNGPPANLEEGEGWDSEPIGLTVVKCSLSELMDMGYVRAYTKKKENESPLMRQAERELEPLRKSILHSGDKYKL